MLLRISCSHRDLAAVLTDTGGGRWRKYTDVLRFGKSVDWHAGVCLTLVITEYFVTRDLAPVTFTSYVLIYQLRI